MTDSPLNKAGGAPDGGEALPSERRAPWVRWSRILVWFLRLMALVWMAKGLAAWADILGFLPSAPPFEARFLGAQATVVYFAVIDLVAAVGLWLTSTWGGVMWLLAVMSHLILTIFFPRIVGGNVATIAVFVSLIVLYLVVSWLAAQEEA
jgi:uncharacterized protein DUF6163